MTVRFRALLLMLVLVVAPLAGQTAEDKRAEAGWLALKQGDANAAATAFEEALKRRPRDPLLHLGAGAAAHLLGRDDDAVTSLTRALQLSPKLTPAAELLGQIKYQQGDLDAAMQLYESALKSAPPGDEATEMRSRLEEWRKEADVHDKLAVRNDSRFSVIFDGRSEQTLAVRTVAILDRAFYRIGEKLGAYPSNRILVTLYTEKQFRDITHMPAWSDGAFDGKIRVPVHGVSQNMDEFESVLVHELTHAMVHGLASRGVPAWLHEGLAGYFEPRDPAAALRRMRTGKTVMSFSELEQGFSRFNAQQAVVAYDESLVAVDLLMHQLGSRMAVLLQGLGNGQSLDDSLVQLGVRRSEYEAQVLRRLTP
jgi:tetratricopeptide (TPR) repeat protein